MRMVKSMDGMTLKTKYNVHVSYLLYFGIVSSFPHHWKQIMRDEEHYIPHVPQPDPLYILQQKNKVCKKIYDNLASQTYGKEMASGFVKWNNYFHTNLTLEEWRQSFCTMYKILKSPKTHIIQFKILHYTLATRDRLLEWGITDSDLCLFCHESIETLPHILLECEVVKQLWKSMRIWLSEKTGVLYHPSTKELILGIDNPEFTVFNCVYLLAKQYVCTCLFDQNFPNMDCFKLFLDEFVKTEKAIVKKNRTDWTASNWQILLPIL